MDDSKLIYPELSYKIVGILFDVYNSMGPKYQEKFYQKAVKEELLGKKLTFEEQLNVHIKFKDNKLGNYFLDFLIEGKIILELKRGERFFKKDFDQVNAYLQATDLKLGILALFSTKGLIFKRIVNIES